MAIIDKRTADTTWKLVDYQCNQLEAAVNNTRTAFLITLTWAFIWLWALYGADVGYATDMVRQAEIFYAHSLENPTSQEFEKACEGQVGHLWKLPGALSQQQKLDACKSYARRKFYWMKKSGLEAQTVSFPWGFGKVSTGDLGIIAQLGLLLIISWMFFAIRRENSAIRALIDMDEESMAQHRWLRKDYILIPKNKYLSPEHMAYAYHAVANRFQFISSSQSKPLLVFTVFFSLLPLLVVLWNLYTDTRDAIHPDLYPLKNGWDMALAAWKARLSGWPPDWKLILQERHSIDVLYRVGGEIILFISVMMMTYLSLRTEFNTNQLLNGWSLAVRDVWMDQWDERTNDPAEPVQINLKDQTAHLLPSEREPDWI